MPVPGFLSSIADKAQSAINASPLAGRIPALTQENPDTAKAGTGDAPAQGGHRSHALNTIQHQLRSLGQQYATTSPVQKIITAEKGVAIDFDSVSRDAKAQSKEFYTWGQSEAADIRDVTDRLAWLNFVYGSLSTSIAIKLDGARASFKALRDAETALTPRRNIRAGFQLQIDRIEHSQAKGMEAKLRELKDQLKTAERADESQEKEVELLKRKAVRETEQIKWKALREYAEKLVLLSQAADNIIAALPSIPPTEAQPYEGAQTTAAARASLQHALDTYQPGVVQLVLPTHPDLGRSDTRSFGESHASELSSIASQSMSSLTPSGIPSSPPASTAPLKDEQPEQPAQPGPIDPAALNQSPAPIPGAAAAAQPSAGEISTSTPPLPTVAETGTPLSGGTQPASGSLQATGSKPSDSSSPGAATATTTTPKYPSAEEEKERLRKEYSATGTSSAPPPASAESVPAASPAHESAEDEKKRLEREQKEERERLLRQRESDNNDSAPADTEDLPPYRDI